MASDINPNEIQQIRFEKEIKIISSLPNLKILPRKAPFSIIIRIIFPPNQLGPKEVHFDLYLEGKYPFQSPKLYYESVHSFPSVADGRDLIEELLQSRWSPSITCSDIIKKIPDFYKSSILPNQEILFSINFGKYHLGSPYLLDLWYKKDGMNSYYCTENDLNNWKYVKERTIVVTHTMILIFELNTQIIDVGYLLSWATIQSLGSIKRAMNEPDRLTFEWKKIGESQPFSQQFKVPQASEMIELISRNIKRIMTMSKERESRKVFSEEDVTGKVIKNLRIVDVLNDIKGLEEDLKLNLSLNGINKLMELYQHAIEYFTATDNLEFQVYLKKLHGLLSDEKVAAVLQGIEVEKSVDKNLESNLEKSLDKSEPESKEAVTPEKVEIEEINATENKEIIIQEVNKENIINEEFKLNKINEEDIISKELLSTDTAKEDLNIETVKTVYNESDVIEVDEKIKPADEILSKTHESLENSLNILEAEKTNKDIQEIVEKFEIGEVSSEDEAN